MFGEIEAKQIQHFIQWSSVAYVAGFLTIMMHTASLGIPVIEVIRPVYIWIGLPIAIVVFTLRYFWKTGKARIDKVKSKFGVVKREMDKIVSGDSFEEISVAQLADVNVDAYALMLRLLPFPFLFAPLFTMLDNRVRRSIERRLIRILRRVDEPSRIKIAREVHSQVRLSNAVVSVWIELQRLLRFITFLFLILTTCYLYIYDLYPQIPQSVGGGKPTTVSLLLTSESLLMESNGFLEMFPSSTSPLRPGKATVTVELELLYSTSEHYYIRTPSERVMSISKALVDGIVWNPS